MARDKSTLLVLGAGASIGARRYPIRASVDEAFPLMPSSRDFFYDLGKGRVEPGHGPRFLHMLGLMFEGTNRLIERAWAIKRPAHGYDPTEWRGVNVEDVFTFLDIGSRMYSRGSGYRRAFERSREALVQFISSILMTRSDGQHCEHLLHILFGLRTNDSIISFNYDTIADFSVQARGGARLRNYLRLMSGKLPRVSDYENKGLLFKLHGSVNWRLCSTHGCRYSRIPILLPARGKVPPTLTNLSRPCPGCKATDASSAIIPPTTQKNLERQDFFHRLWLIARAQLPRFKRIIFIGYSFPPNDPYSEWLFRQLRFVDRATSPQIVVVNPEAERPHSVLARRYSHIFKGLSIEFYGSLATFVKESWPLDRKRTRAA